MEGDYDGIYHGSNIRIEKPDFAFCKPFKDFGKGFYLSAEKEQALDLAKQRVRELMKVNPSSMYFHLMSH